jgi:alpha-tubulin suppressor-like RCC1 family protein
MKSLRIVAALALLAIPGSFATGTACRTPTDMTVHVLTDVPCARQRGVVVVAASPEEYEHAPPAGRSQQCTQVSDTLYDLGTIVLVPHSDGSDRLGIRVVLGLSKDAESCAGSSDYDGCIVARRLLHYLPHDELTVEVLLREDCANVPCSADSTCIGHGCKSAEVDPESCKPKCDEGSIGAKCTNVGEVTCTAGVRTTCQSDGTTKTESCGLKCSKTECIGATSLSTLGGSGDRGASCMLVDGDVWCWGSNDHGELGVTGMAESSVPVKVPGIPKIKQLASTPTSNHQSALAVDGTVWCWGANESGQCGETGTATTAPRQIAGLANIVSIASGSTVTCATDSSLKVSCNGSNSQGQLGRGATSSHDGTPKPVLATGWSGRAIGMACGAAACCVADDQKKIACWGRNASGQVGANLSDTIVPTPTAVSLPAGAIALAAGDNSFCVALEDSRIACWGSASWGVFVGATTDQRVPFIMPSLSGVTNLAVGAQSGHFAWTKSGKVFAWGSDGIVKGAPAEVPSLAGTTLVTTAWNHACALVAGNVLCWGDNVAGDLGDGTTTPRPTTPAPIKSPF